MTQSTLNGNSYERQASLKASMTLESSMIQAGLLKPESMEDAFLICETYTKRFLALLTEGQDTATLTQTGFTNTDTPDTEINYSPCTEKQAKAIYVITHNKVKGRWVENDKAQYLTKEPKEYSFDEAGVFIETHGNKN